MPLLLFWFMPLVVVAALWGAGAQPQYEPEVLPMADGVSVPCLLDGRGRPVRALIASAACFKAWYSLPDVLGCILDGYCQQEQGNSKAAGLARPERAAEPDETGGRVPLPGAVRGRRAEPA